MSRGCIFIFVFAAVIQIGSFDPKPLDHLTVNLNVDDSPKEQAKGKYYGPDSTPGPYDYGYEFGHYLAYLALINAAEEEEDGNYLEAPNNLPIDTVAKVKFILFTGLTDEDEDIHFDGTTVILASNTKFDPSKPIKIVIHGWNQSDLVNGQVVQKNGNDYPEDFNRLYKINGMDYTVLGVNWVPFAGWPLGNEELMTSSSEDAANTIARLLSALARDHNISGNQLHMIGHSMGTVVTSKTAKKIQEMGLKPMSRITLLDPCPSTQTPVISKTDADFVEAIHTSSQGICSETPLAHVDFYPNGGDAQICGSSPCSCLDGSSVCDECYHGKSRCLKADGTPDWMKNHRRSIALYRGSIGKPKVFLSWKCSQTYQQFVDNGRRCENDEGREMVPMGEHSLDGGRPEDGLYFLETSGEPPIY